MKPRGDLSGHRLILVDCNFLVAWTNPKTSRDDRARLDHFLETATKSKQKIVIPTPVIAEYLVRADAAGVEWLETLESKAAVEVVPFDRTAAFETAQLDRAALGAGDKKDGSTSPWQKIKIDRQIIGVAKALGCRACITSDDDLSQNARRAGMQVFAIADLDLPVSALQGQLPLEKPKRKIDPAKPSEKAPKKKR